MTSLTSESLSELSAPRVAPCISLYQPTHRRHPENRQDPIRFRNLVKDVQGSLAQKYPATEARWLLEPFEALAHDDDFWNHALDGLAVLAALGFLRVFRLPRPVTELVVVADSFHIKPLWRFVQSVDRYQVLGLSLHKIRLFEGDRDALKEVELAPTIPRTITEALGSELPLPHHSIASHGATGAARAGMHHRHGGRVDEADIDTEKFFRSIDRAILEHHSRPTGLPLILAALPEHHHRFHDVSQNPFLLTGRISVNPDAVTNDVLRTLAWQVAAPLREARLAKLEDEFVRARAAGLGSDELPQVSEAAAAGRVATLLIDADRLISGHLDDASSRSASDALSNPPNFDLLDDLGELVRKLGGEVVVVRETSLAARTGVAAIYRY